LVLAILFLLFKPAGPLLDKGYYSRLVTDRQGVVLRITLSNDEKYRVKCSLATVGPFLREAVLLKEDRYFYYHPGVNSISLVRAFYQTSIRKGPKVGGSTITMQVARLYYKLKTRSISGKLGQIIRALYLEIFYSKDEIFEAYLNLAPCGGNIEGFESGALIYFGKTLDKLSLQEVLFLTVLPQKPFTRNPHSLDFETDLRAARQRLFQLWQQHHPEDENKTAHFNMPLAVGNHLPFTAPHFANAILQKNRESGTIKTTLDLKYQNLIKRHVHFYLERKRSRGVFNAAAMLVDTKDMSVLASLGSADFFDDTILGQVDGTRARRSPGSTLKPFIYALAMEQGLIHPMTMLKDAPTSFSEYSPDNYLGDFKGPVKAWEALISSRNVPAVRLAAKIRNPDLYGFLHKCEVGDLRPRGHYGLSIVLGGAELSMTELVNLYGILANGGMYLPVKRVQNRQEIKPVEILDEDVCYLTLEMLRKNPRPGKSRTVQTTEAFGAAAYKTGTSIGFKDCWSIGIFEHYIIAVWLGNFDGYGNPEFKGRYLATPLMFEIIDSIRSESDYNSEPLPIPVGHKEISVCRVSGQIPQPYCEHTVKTAFIPGRSPITTCKICREITVNTTTGYRTNKKTGPGIEKQVYEFWPTDLLKLFRQAGVPRKVPPPFDPAEKVNTLGIIGQAPEIVSPRKFVHYVYRQGEDDFHQLPLIVNVDADVQHVYWFIDKTFIGRVDPEEKLYWPLAVGRYMISVVDDHGRTNFRRVVVVAG